MITLTPITDPRKLDEYFRFRYSIYNESRQKGFLGDKSGIDKDVFDERAMHYGWYVDGKLAGCVRFVEPDRSEKPLPMFAYLSDASAHDAVSVYIAMRKAHGQRMVEASRFCLAKQHRGLRTAKQFVLAMLRAVYPLGIEHGLFDCDTRHARFYQAVGLEPLPGAERFQMTGLQYTSTALRYSLGNVLRHQPDLPDGMGLVQTLGGRLAA